MNEIAVILYTMNGCPFCKDFKDMLIEQGIEFYERDIEKFSDEYDKFSKIVENDLIPAFMIIESDGENNMKSFLYAPDRNYNELTEAVQIIKEHKENLGIL
jgi:glutaredoxin